MSSVAPVIPVVIFAYARPDHLRQVLASLRENGVPMIEVFCDGAKGLADLTSVHAVRQLVHEIDWCDVQVHERPENLGLGRNVIAGVTEVARRHDAFIVWEDDLIGVPGTYAWMVEALRYYAADDRVMSLTAWTHPRVTPLDTGKAPYFDGRAECWVWGTWARAWRGMTTEDALRKREMARLRGIAGDAYGADLPAMAAREVTQNIWAVRWLYHHLQHGGLCVRPPWSMVEHIGFDATATNAQFAHAWANPPLREAPPIPAQWPAPVEHPRCRALWTSAEPRRWRRLLRRLFGAFRR